MSEGPLRVTCSSVHTGRAEASGDVHMHLEEAFEDFVAQVEHLEALLSRGADDLRQRRFVHSSAGMETAPFLVCHSADPASRYCLYYRCHAWLLALGGSPTAICDAILSPKSISPMQPRVEGLPVDFISVTVGAQLPVALGLALAGRPAVATVGDGGLSSGVVFESLNSAAIHRPDLLVVLDDNGRAISSARSTVCRAEPSVLCSSLDLEYFAVPAGDIGVFAVALDWVRSTSGTPRLLHVTTSRSAAHCLSMAT